MQLPGRRPHLRPSTAARLRGKALLAGAVAGLAWTPPLQAALAPTDLRCEYGRDPAGIDVPRPRLFWTLSSPDKNQRQSAYQILAASSPALLEQNTGDLWDSGKVDSAQSVHVEYAGRALSSSQQVFWKVRAWDAANEASPWSAPARWTMGLLSPEDWRGKWICAPAATEALLLRKEFVVRTNLARAVAHVSGLGQYEMFLNGAKVGEDLLAPGWTDYDDTVLYDTHEVAAQLRPGLNAVGLALGNGMYHVVRRHRFAKFTGSFGPLRAMLHLRLEYVDGAVETVGTDESWRVHPGPVTYNSIYGGEDYDARLNPAGWSRPGFGDADWKPAVAVVRPAGTLRGFTAGVEPIRAIESRAPAAVRDFPGTGVSVYDLGQNASYMPRLRVSGPRGSKVTLVPAEVVNPDGSIQRSTMGSTNRGISWWEYTKATDETESWFPQFYYVGCRYLEARLTPPQPGAPLPRLESLEGVIVHASAAPAGEFSCSDPLLNRIRDLVRWAQRANMVSVLTDCPHREKLGWLEQYHLNGPAIRYEFDLARMFTKGMNDMAEAQLEDGLVPNIAPEYTRFQGPFRAAAEWGAAFILVPWQQYLFCGDVALLKRHYPAMKRYFAWLESRAADHGLQDGLGDWFDLGPNKPGKAQLTPPEVTASAFYFHDALTLSRIAQVVGLPEDARQFADKAGVIRARYNQRFFDAARGQYASGSQCANALPLAMGIVEETHRPAVLAALVRDLESRGYATSAGDIGFRFVLRALAEGRRSDVIYRMLTQEARPGYAWMLKQGATSLTESWDANLTTSHNHFMLGHVTEWFYHDLAGIAPDPAGPGFKKILIRPQPVRELRWVKAAYHSLHGRIESEWQLEGDRFQLRVKIPPNTSATIQLPGQGVAGTPAGPFQAGSGEHVFQSRL